MKTATRLHLRLRINRTTEIFQRAAVFPHASSGLPFNRKAAAFPPAQHEPLSRNKIMFRPLSPVVDQEGMLVSQPFRASPFSFFFSGWGRPAELYFLGVLFGYGFRFCAAGLDPSPGTNFKPWDEIVARHFELKTVERNRRQRGCLVEH